VFDIKQGVAICLATRGGAESGVAHAELWGSREVKYAWFAKHRVSDTGFKQITPDSPFYFFEPQNTDCRAEYDAGWKVTDIFPVNGVGAVMARDSMTVDLDADALWERVKDFVSLPPEKARTKYELGKDARDWRVATAQADVQASGPTKKKICAILYRPFDERFTYYTGNSRGFYASPCRKVMSNMAEGDNLGMALSRSVEIGRFEHVFCTKGIIGHHSVSLKEVNYLCPLWLVPTNDAPATLLREDSERQPNLAPPFLRALAAALCLKTTGAHDLPSGLTPEDIFQYAYAVFHSPGYRSRYAEFLKIDFPRLPLTGDLELFRALARLGGELTALHLLESPKLAQPITEFIGGRNPEVEKVSWSGNTVWIDKAQTTGFKGVPEEVWTFHIGGYQVCNKWLKDRKGRTLSKDDIAHYQKIVVALAETIRLMKEIDEVIEQHGGWPGAFQTGEARTATAKVIPFRPRTVEPKPEERYATCVPLVPLKAAAGAFGDPQHVEDEGFEWVAVESRHHLRPGMFVAQVVGKSMEPAIPDSAWCLFRASVEGTRQGKTVLVQLRNATDPETGQRYTVKRYESEKTTDRDSWRHARITLKPVNSDFDPIVLTGEDEGELQVVAELVEVLTGEVPDAEN